MVEQWAQSLVDPRAARGSTQAARLANKRPCQFPESEVRLRPWPRWLDDRQLIKRVSPPPGEVGTTTEIATRSGPAWKDNLSLARAARHAPRGRSGGMGSAARRHKAARKSHARRPRCQWPSSTPCRARHAAERVVLTDPTACACCRRALPRSAARNPSAIRGGSSARLPGAATLRGRQSTWRRAGAVRRVPSPRPRRSVLRLAITTSVSRFSISARAASPLRTRRRMKRITACQRLELRPVIRGIPACAGRLWAFEGCTHAIHNRPCTYPGVFPLLVVSGARSRSWRPPRSRCVRWRQGQCRLACSQHAGRCWCFRSRQGGGIRSSGDH